MKPTTITFLACVLITFVLGSIHAFSVFLVPLETMLQTSRAQVSLIYSAALLCLTCAVLLGYKIYPVCSAPVLAGLTCMLAGCGTFLAGHSASYFWVAIGYAVIFGGANGIGYGFALQLSAQAMPQRKGIAMGTVTASYALGAAIAPIIYKYGLLRGGLEFAMNLASAILVIAGIIVFLLLKSSKAQYLSETKTPIKPSGKGHSIPTQLLLWLAYGTGSTTGLMVLGHATGIVQSIGGSAQLAVLALTLITLANMSGGLIAGWLADNIQIRYLLLSLPFSSAVVAGILSVNTSAQVLVLGLCIIGFCYGAIIAIYPVVVSSIFGAVDSSKIYGRVFTAWGIAGLAGPWIAGYLFDQTGGYTLSLLIAGGVSLVSALAVSGIRTLKQQ